MEMPIQISPVESRPEALSILRPTRLGFGAGALDLCTAYLAESRFRRIFLVKSPHLRGLEPTLEAWRDAAGELVVSDAVPPEPDIAAFEQVLAAAGPEPLDAVIGLGGGSVLDVAKLVAALHGSPVRLGELLDGARPPVRRTALICLPTTSGTGSEVSPNAILYDAAARAKRAAIGPALVPDAAFIDPRLTLSLPPDITAATGIDALSHCIEAYTNRRAHPLVDLYALEGVRLIAGAIERAVRHGDDLEARTALALGSLYGGYCLGPVNTAGVHALSYPLGSAFRLPHGLSNALLLPHVMRFNIPAAPERHAALARAMGAGEGDSATATAEAGIVHLAALMRRCGLPAGIGACGVTAADIPGLAAAAIKVTRLLQNNPRPISLTDAEHLYHQAI